MPLMFYVGYGGQVAMALAAEHMVSDGAAFVSASRDAARAAEAGRIVTFGVKPDRPATDDEDLVIRVELEASRREPYRQLSRLFHLLGRRC